jgi:predicted amidohydrolase YtcJ
MPNAREAYPALDGRGLLTARVVGALWWDRDRGLEQVDELVELRHRTSTDRYRPTTVKIMVDGVCESFTARMLEPYLDGTGAPTDNRGLQYVEPDLLRRAVTVLDGAGFQVHLHTIGDGAVRHALDAIEAARTANGPGDHRHHLAHLQVVHPDDRPRFRRLGVVANIQPLWASNDPQMTELTIPFLGSERASWQYPFGSLAGEGAILAVGSDWPVSSPDVLPALHVAVHRISPPGYPYAGTDEAATTPFLPEERIDLARAIRAATMGSAHVNHLDDVTGSIEVGKDADLVVLSADPFGPDPDPTPRVEMTLVGGRAVFDELDR